MSTSETSENFDFNEESLRPTHEKKRRPILSKIRCTKLPVTTSKTRIIGKDCDQREIQNIETKLLRANTKLGRVLEDYYDLMNKQKMQAHSDDLSDIQSQNSKASRIAVFSDPSDHVVDAVMKNKQETSSGMSYFLDLRYLDEYSEVGTPKALITSRSKASSRCSRETSYFLYFGCEAKKNGNSKDVTTLEAQNRSRNSTNNECSSFKGGARSSLFKNSTLVADIGHSQRNKHYKCQTNSVGFPNKDDIKRIDTKVLPMKRSSTYTGFQERFNRNDSEKKKSKSECSKENSFSSGLSYSHKPGEGETTKYGKRGDEKPLKATETKNEGSYELMNANYSFKGSERKPGVEQCKLDNLNQSELESVDFRNEISIKSVTLKRSSTYAGLCYRKSASEEYTSTTEQCKHESQEKLQSNSVDTTLDKAIETQSYIPINKGYKNKQRSISPPKSSSLVIGIEQWKHNLQLLGSDNDDPINKSDGSGITLKRTSSTYAGFQTSVNTFDTNSTYDYKLGEEATATSTKSTKHGERKLLTSVEFQYEGSYEPITKDNSFKGKKVSRIPIKDSLLVRGVEQSKLNRGSEGEIESVGFDNENSMNIVSKSVTLKRSSTYTGLSYHQKCSKHDENKVVKTFETPIIKDCNSKGNEYKHHKESVPLVRITEQYKHESHDKFQSKSIGFDKMDITLKKYIETVSQGCDVPVNKGYELKQRSISPPKSSSLVLGIEQWKHNLEILDSDNDDPINKSDGSGITLKRTSFTYAGFQTSVNSFDTNSTYDYKLDEEATATSTKSTKHGERKLLTSVEFQYEGSYEPIIKDNSFKGKKVSRIPIKDSLLVRGVEQSKLKRGSEGEIESVGFDNENSMNIVSKSITLKRSSTYASLSYQKCSKQDKFQVKSIGSDKKDTISKKSTETQTQGSYLLKNKEYKHKQRSSSPPKSSALVPGIEQFKHDFHDQCQSRLLDCDNKDPIKSDGKLLTPKRSSTYVGFSYHQKCSNYGESEICKDIGAQTQGCHDPINSRYNFTESERKRINAPVKSASLVSSSEQSKRINCKKCQPKSVDPVNKDVIKKIDGIISSKVPSIETTSDYAIFQETLNTNNNDNMKDYLLCSIEKSLHSLLSDNQQEFREANADKTMKRSKHGENKHTESVQTQKQGCNDPIHKESIENSLLVEDIEQYKHKNLAEGQSQSVVDEINDSISNMKNSHVLSKNVENVNINELKQPKKSENSQESNFMEKYCEEELKSLVKELDSRRAHDTQNRFKSYEAPLDDDQRYKSNDWSSVYRTDKKSKLTYTKLESVPKDNQQKSNSLSLDSGQKQCYESRQRYDKELRYLETAKIPVPLSSEPKQYLDDPNKPTCSKYLYSKKERNNADELKGDGHKNKLPNTDKTKSSFYCGIHGTKPRVIEIEDFDSLLTDESEHFTSKCFYCRQQNFIRNFKKGTLTQIQILRGICRFQPNMRQTPVIGSGCPILPRVDVRYLCYMENFVNEVLDLIKVDTPNLKFYLNHLYIPACMFVEEKEFPFLDNCKMANQNKLLRKDHIQRLDKKLQKYFDEKKHVDNYQMKHGVFNYCNEVICFYMVNSFYRALLRRAMTNEQNTKLKIYNAISIMEVFLSMNCKEEDSFSYERYYKWICKTEHTMNMSLTELTK